MMSTTMESATMKMDTTTTMEDFTTTTIVTTQGMTTISTDDVEITTLPTTATSEISTGTTVQGDATNIIFKMQKIVESKKSMEKATSNVTTKANLIELSTIETTTTMNSVNVTENMKDIGMKVNTNESYSGITTTTLANELTTTDITITSTPTVSTVTDSSMTTTENDLITFTETFTTSDIETKKHSIKPLVNQIIDVEVKTTSTPTNTTLSNLETTSEISTTSVPTQLEHIKLQTEENTSTSATNLITNKIKPTVSTTTSAPLTTVSMFESRGRMSTYTTPTIYTDTEPNMLLENEMMDIFGTNMQPKTTGTDVNVIIAIVVSIVGVIALLLLIGFLYLIRRRQKQTKQSQRCHPISSDAYSLDNISAFGSGRRKSLTGRASKRTYGNAAFDDPALSHNVLSINELPKFVEHRHQIFAEFRNIPDVTAKITEVPPGCEDKNR